MVKLRYGHAPGHVREAAGDAFEAWLKWDGTLPEPTVEYETNYVPRQITISQACRLVWNCTDIVGGDLFAWVQNTAHSNDRNIKTQTYAACARYILADIKATAPVTA
jgi:hypothetical protein